MPGAPVRPAASSTRVTGSCASQRTRTSGCSVRSASTIARSRREWPRPIGELSTSTSLPAQGPGPVPWRGALGHDGRRGRPAWTTRGGIHTGRHPRDEPVDLVVDDDGVAHRGGVPAPSSTTMKPRAPRRSARRRRPNAPGPHCRAARAPDTSRPRAPRRGRWARRRRARGDRTCSRQGSAGRPRAPTRRPPHAAGSSAARGTSGRRRTRRSRRSRRRASGDGCTSPSPPPTPADRRTWRAPPGRAAATTLRAARSRPRPAPARGARPPPGPPTRRHWRARPAPRGRRPRHP